MGVLQEAGVEYVYHYAPLHYLPFIARDRELLSKPSLAARGFSSSHLRSKSSHHDINRGFGNYAFLTLDDDPRILKAKLAAGFPHIGIGVAAADVEGTTFDLCRFNVAMTRKLRRGGKLGHDPSPTNGSYYDTHEIPVGRTTAEKQEILAEHLHRTMIEVLVHGDVSLSDNTVVQTYSAEDAATAQAVLEDLSSPWSIEVVPAPAAYNRNDQYVQQVDSFIEKALSDPNWRGNGLEFDKL